MRCWTLCSPEGVTALADRSEFARWWRRRVWYPLEAVLVFSAYGLVRLLPLDTASAFGSWIGRTIGPHLGATRQAIRNLERAMPDLTPAQRHAIVIGMWDNLGRMMGEYPHTARLWDPAEARIDLVGVEIFDRLATGGQSCLIVSGHIGNWELLPYGAERRGLPITAIYRAPNNPWLDRLVRTGRGLVRSQLVPKGKEGARAVLKTVAGGGAVAMLIDQKMNDGIAVPFFGRPAMTAPAVAYLALRYRCPIVPVRIERLDGPRFRITVFEPLHYMVTGNREQDAHAIMLDLNRRLEAWIRERPEQWLWLHRRWPD